jgi:hypothetical protein
MICMNIVKIASTAQVVLHSTQPLTTLDESAARRKQQPQQRCWATVFLAAKWASPGNVGITHATVWGGIGAGA